MTRPPSPPRHRYVLGARCGTGQVALTAKERQEIAASQSEILRAWALAVGPPLLAGLLPFGLGPMAAANYMQYVLKGRITAAARVFGSAGPCR
jgi:hypothetical protein